MESELQRIGVSLESNLLDQFDQILGSKGYTSRSEAIRDLIRDYLIEQEWNSGEREMIGTITMVYNHHLREMTERLTELQHNYHDQIISVLHVHMDAHNCLEVLVVKGKGTDIQTINGRLSSTKGVKHCKLVITTTGEHL